jgi:hypothetical protein
VNAADLTAADAALTERVANVQRELANLEAITRRLDERAYTTATELAVLRQQFDDHLKRYELRDGQRWAVTGLFIASLLGLAANLILFALRVPAK